MGKTVKSRFLTYFLALFCLFIYHNSYSQFGPGGVGDNGEFVLWLPHQELPNISFTNPAWNDISGYDNHAQTVPLGIPQVADSVFGFRQGARFWGLQFLTVASKPELNFDNEFALAAVFSRTGSDPNRMRFVLSKGADKTDSVGYSISESSAYVKSRVSDGTTEYFDSAAHGGIATPSFALINYSKPLQNLSINTGLATPSDFIHGQPLGSLQNSESLVIAGGPFGDIMDNWVGYMGEVVAFNRKLNIAEVLILENYLAATFSIPAARDYFAFDNTHSYDVAGIGKMDAGNVQNDAKGLGIVRIDQPSDLQDGEFLLWGHDNRKATSGGVEENIWRIDRTGGDPGTVRVRLYLQGYGVTNQSEVSLVVAKNQNLVNPIIYSASNWDATSKVLTIENVDLPDGNYFTIDLSLDNSNKSQSVTALPAIDQCPADINTSNDNGACGAIVSWVPPTSNGTLTSSHNPGDFFPVGTTGVTYTATNIDGSIDCSFNVTVLDNELPVINNCPSDITITTGGNCNQIANWTTPTIIDNCTAVLVGSHNSGDSFPLGITTVTYAATDAAGNTAICNFNINIVDNEQPTLSNCNPAISITDFQSNTNDAIVTWPAPNAADNCSISSFISSHNSGDRFQVGTTLVTYTATDASGNSSSCTFEVTVTAPVNMAPTVEAKKVTVNAGETITICLQASDPEGDEMILSPIDINGVLGSIGTIDPSGFCFDYTAPDQFEGVENISTTICDDGDPQGCTQTNIQMNVEMVWELEISQIITPNGDGINDTWVIGNIDKYPNNRVMIFDRWGTMLYRANNYNNDSICWSGKDEEGNHSGSGSVHSGTYYYLLEIENRKSYRGFIELVKK